MGESLNRRQFLEMIGHVLDRLESSAEELNRLDAAVGDGDLGVTMTLGCRAVRNVLPGLSEQDLGTIVAKCGMAFNGAAPSTMGALLAIGAMRAGKEGRGAQELDVALLARMARAAETGIKEKGQAERGDKTLLDALGPSADSLESAARDGVPLAVAVRAATAAARAGVEATIPMKAKSGRAAWITERTAGQPDPGATVVRIIWEAFEEYLTK
ncbi:MAG: dihydroxyacetone kinase subunit L [Sphingomonadaceae bacterium]